MYVTDITELGKFLQRRSYPFTHGFSCVFPSLKVDGSKIVDSSSMVRWLMSRTRIDKRTHTNWSICSEIMPISQLGSRVRQDITTHVRTIFVGSFKRWLRLAASWGGVYTWLCWGWGVDECVFLSLRRRRLVCWWKFIELFLLAFWSYLWWGDWDWRGGV